MREFRLYGRPRMSIFHVPVSKINSIRLSYLTIDGWIDQMFLDAQHCIQTVLTKSSGTDTCFYNRQQMARSLDFCQTSEPGRWIRPILVALERRSVPLNPALIVALRGSDQGKINGCCRP